MWLKSLIPLFSDHKRGKHFYVQFFFCLFSQSFIVVFLNVISLTVCHQNLSPAAPFYDEFCSHEQILVILLLQLQSSFNNVFLFWTVIDRKISKLSWTTQLLNVYDQFSHTPMKCEIAIFNNHFTILRKPHVAISIR